MKYLFITLSILVIWFAIIIIAAMLPANAEKLYFVAQGMTAILFLIGFYKK